MGCVRHMEEDRMIERPPIRPHVSSKVRAYGKARIDIARRAVTRQDWDTLWKRPQNDFPFTWGKYWKQCIEYRVDDFASEVGFFIDILGLPVIAFDPSYAMFTSPAGEFAFSVVQALEGSYSTPADAIRIQFMVDDVFATTEELGRRGIVFEQNPEPLSEGSILYVATFQTPHGICMDVWGEVAPEMVETVEIIPADEEEADPADAELDDRQVKLEPDEISAEAAEVDDLFEEIRDEPKVKRTVENKTRSKADEIVKEDSEAEFHDKIQYVDEPDVTYPAYQPIPLRK